MNLTQKYGSYVKQNMMILKDLRKRIESSPQAIKLFFVKHRPNQNAQYNEYLVITDKISIATELDELKSIQLFTEQFHSLLNMQHNLVRY